jgi:S-adenosylmethionine hydrolase
MQRLPVTDARLTEAGVIRGRVVTFDRFGNLVTDIKVALLQQMLGRDMHQTLCIRLGQEIILPLAPAYASVPPGQLLAVIGSRDTLEVAVNQGRACDMLQAGPGTPLTVARAGASGPGESSSS